MKPTKTQVYDAIQGVRIDLGIVLNDEICFMTTLQKHLNALGYTAILRVYSSGDRAARVNVCNVELQMKLRGCLTDIEEWERRYEDRMKRYMDKSRRK